MPRDGMILSESPKVPIAELRSVMRCAMLCVLLVMVGCSKQDRSPGGGKQEPVGPNTFDANDLDKTLAWVNGELTALREIQKGGNEIAANDGLRKLQATFAKCEGTPVIWRVRVEKVQSDAVILSTSRLTEVWNNQQNTKWPVVLNVTAVPAGDLPKSLLHSYDDPAFGKIPIGIAITRERAAKLRSGQTVEVRGVLKRFALDGYSEKLFCNAIITDGRIAE